MQHQEGNAKPAIKSTTIPPVAAASATAPTAIQ
jgi:hypothetical protein